MSYSNVLNGGLSQSSTPVEIINAVTDNNVALLKAISDGGGLGGSGTQAKTQTIVCQANETITELVLQQAIRVNLRNLVTVTYSAPNGSDDILIYGTDFDIDENALNKIRITKQQGYFVDYQGKFVIQYYV